MTCFLVFAIRVWSMQFDKPGCFGNAITYSCASKACSACDSSSQCRLAARQRIEELRPIIIVEAILKIAHREPQTASNPVSLTASDLPSTAQKILAMIPANAQKVAESLIRTKVNFRKSLIEGVNPIRNQRPLAVSVLFDLLIEGPVDRGRYMMMLKERLGHSPTTAASQASIGAAVVLGLGIAKVDNGKMVIRR